MGHPAHYVTREGGKWALLYSHWGGTTVDRDLAWGPEHAPQMRAPRWLASDDVEGGAVVDFDERVLLLFGGEDACFSPLHQRITVAVIQEIWAGWTVRWAFDGLHEVRSYVGLRTHRMPSAHRSREPLLDEYSSGVLSVRHTPERQSIVRTSTTIETVFTNTPAYVLEHIRGRYPDGYLEVPLDGERAPSYGVHITIAKRRVDVWHTDVVPGLQFLFNRRWRGWELVRHGARFEAQQALTGGALQLQCTRHPKSVLKGVRLALLQADDFDPAEYRARVERDLGGGVLTVPAWFYAHAATLPDAKTRRRLFEAAAARISLTSGSPGGMS